MSRAEQIKAEVKDLLEQGFTLLKDFMNHNEEAARHSFGHKYQRWYSKALKVLELLGKDRLNEFTDYYLIDKKRKTLNERNYSIQDYLMLNEGDDPTYLSYSPKGIAQTRFHNQIQIVGSLESRIDSVIADVYGSLLADLEDKELQTAKSLMKTSLRASGALAGVVLEKHLQRVAVNHGIIIKKRNPTIADLNDPLKQAGVYDNPLWRKVQHLADIRNLCSHNKNREPTKDEVEDLISGVSTVVKTLI